MGCKNSKKAAPQAAEATELPPAEATELPPPQEGKEAEEAEVTDATDQSPPEAEQPKQKEPTIRPGVHVTTVDGKEGEVVRCTTTDVTLKIGDAEVTVDIESIYVVKVKVYSVRDVRAADFFTGKSDPYVTVEIDGKPTSKVQTSVQQKVVSCTWDEEFELLGYTAGAKVRFVVGDQDNLKADDVLGKFELSSDKFETAVFDEEVELPEEEAKKTGAYLRIKVSLSPLLEATTEEGTTPPVEATTEVTTQNDTPAGKEEQGQQHRFEMEAETKASHQCWCF
jgi:hypothetical protein